MINCNLHKSYKYKYKILTWSKKSNWHWSCNEYAESTNSWSSLQNWESSVDISLLDTIVELLPENAVNASSQNDILQANDSIP